MSASDQAKQATQATPAQGAEIPDEVLEVMEAQDQAATSLQQELTAKQQEVQTMKTLVTKMRTDQKTALQEIAEYKRQEMVYEGRIEKGKEEEEAFKTEIARMQKSIEAYQEQLKREVKKREVVERELDAEKKKVRDYQDKMKHGKQTLEDLEKQNLSVGEHISKAEEDLKKSHGERQRLEIKLQAAESRCFSEATLKEVTEGFTSIIRKLDLRRYLKKTPAPKSASPSTTTLPSPAPQISQQSVQKSPEPRTSEHRSSKHKSAEPRTSEHRSSKHKSPEQKSSGQKRRREPAEDEAGPSTRNPLPSETPISPRTAKKIRLAELRDRALAVTSSKGTLTITSQPSLKTWEEHSEVEEIARDDSLSARCMFCGNRSVKSIHDYECGRHYACPNHRRHYAVAEVCMKFLQANPEKSSPDLYSIHPPEGYALGTECPICFKKICGRWAGDLRKILLQRFKGAQK